MLLDEVDTEEQLVAAWEDEDEDELRDEASTAVRKLVESGWGHGGTIEYGHAYTNYDYENAEEEFYVNMVKDYLESNDPLDLFYSRYQDEMARILHVLPEERVEAAVLELVQEAAEYAASPRVTRHSRGQAWHFTTDRCAGVDLTSTTYELVVRLDGPLAWVPEDAMTEMLDEHGPMDAEWEKVDEDTYSSGWVDGYDYWRLAPAEGFDEIEWANDLRTEYFSGLVDAEPDKAIAVFMSVLKSEMPELHKKVKKQKFPKDVLADYAVAFFTDPDEGLELISEAVGAWGYEGTRAPVLLTVDQDTLRQLGITQGKWWDGAPWNLYNLPPEELAYEGTRMRHCVGNFNMGYRQAVANGDIFIWSLRSRFNRPILTWEVLARPWNRVPEADLSERARSLRGQAVKQLVGKVNRPSGKGADEVAVLRWIFWQLGIDDEYVRDFQPRRSNPGLRPGYGFDAPYRDPRFGRLMAWW